MSRALARKGDIHPLSEQVLTEPEYDNKVDNIKEEVYIDPDLKDLFEILALRRAADSQGELSLIKRYIIPTGADRDEFGNWYLKIGDSNVLWSSHTDTVHRENDKAPIHQKLTIDEAGIVGTSNGSCLGADNGVGVWLMLKMIEAGKEGLYVFHRQEESGGQGSQFFARNNLELLKYIDIAIAFDRRDTKSVITYQGCRTCSDEFADSLIDGLQMHHVKDDTGTFTDTKQYRKIIPECTNISAGFFNEHSRNEVLDTVYVKRLLEALLNLDVSNLVIKRDETLADSYKWSGNQYPYSRFNDDWSWEGGYYKGRLDENDSSMMGLISDINGEEYAHELITENPDMVYRILKAWGMVSSMVDDLHRLT